MARTSARARRSAGAYAVANMPVCSVLPAITGTATVGETLSCSTGTWSQSPSFSRIWQRDGVPIAAATGATYDLVAEDEDAVITCTVVARKNGAQAVATSAGTDPVAAA